MECGKQSIYHSIYIMPPKNSTSVDFFLHSRITFTLQLVNEKLVQSLFFVTLDTQCSLVSRTLCLKEHTRGNAVSRKQLNASRVQLEILK